MKQFLTKDGALNMVDAIAQWVVGKLNAIKSTFASKTQAGMVKLGDGLRTKSGVTDGTVEVDTAWLALQLQDYKTFIVVTTLPVAPASGNEGKIHIVPDATKTKKAGSYNNICKEYAWVQSGDSYGWELIGSFSAADIDLSAYVTTAKLESEAADGHAYTPTAGEITLILQSSIDPGLGS